MYNFTDEEIIAAIKISYSQAETLRNLGFYTYAGKTWTKWKTKIQSLNVDTSHWVLNPGGSKIKYSDEEVFKENSKISRGAMKARIIANGLIEYKCSECSQNHEWNNKALNLIIDHINGINNDNRIENLRFLCPNCNSQTDTYCGRNVKLKFNEVLCKTCQKLISSNATFCKKCYGKHKYNQQLSTKIKWPPNEELKNRLANSSYSALGRELGVSDNAIRKRLSSAPTRS